MRIALLSHRPYLSQDCTRLLQQPCQRAALALLLKLCRQSPNLLGPLPDRMRLHHTPPRILSPWAGLLPVHRLTVWQVWAILTPYGRSERILHLRATMIARRWRIRSDRPYGVRIAQTCQTVKRWTGSRPAHGLSIRGGV